MLPALLGTPGGPEVLQEHWKHKRVLLMLNLYVARLHTGLTTY